ncbi:MAG TPA: hypothetical protein VIM10_04375 [Actinopolymorphaceae bacterium]
MKRRAGSVVALIATVLALALTAASCGSRSANDAVVVGQTRYSMSYLADTTTAYLNETGQSGLTGSDLATVQATLITEFIVNQLTIQAAAQLGVGVPDSRASALKAQLQNDVQYANVRKSAVIPEARLDDMVRWTLSRTAVGDKLANITSASDSGNGASQQAAAAYIANLAASEGVWVNPVFGKWDGQQLQVGGGALVAVPTASPTAVAQ